MEKYEECAKLDPKDKIYVSNIIACLIELHQLDTALERCEEVQKTFDSDNVDFKVRARILQRKGTIYLRTDR